MTTHTFTHRASPSVSIFLKDTAPLFRRRVTNIFQLPSSPPNSPDSMHFIHVNKPHPRCYFDVLKNENYSLYRNVILRSDPEILLLLLLQLNAPFITSSNKVKVSHVPPKKAICVSNPNSFLPQLFFPEARFRSYPREEGESWNFSYPLIDMAADDKDKQKQKASASGPTDWNKMEIKFKNPEFQVRRTFCGFATKNPLKRAHQISSQNICRQGVFYRLQTNQNSFVETAVV